MVHLFVGSTGDQAGQSLVTWALARRLAERGLRVGFFKPLAAASPQEETPEDEDALLFREVLNLQEPLEQISPRLPPDTPWRQREPQEILEVLRPSLDAASSGKDILLVMGSRAIFLDDPSHPLSDIALIHALDAACLLVNRYRDSASALYSILSICSLLRDRVRGILLTRAPAEKVGGISGQLVPFLAQKGLPRIAVVPEDPLLASRSLREVVELVSAQVLSPGETLERPVGGMTVGTVSLGRSLELFKRVYNKIVFLEPDPVDWEEETPGPSRRVAGILLTGGRSPASVVMGAAEKAGVALLLVNSDTFETLDRLERSPPVLSPGDEVKVRRLTELLDREGALDALTESFAPDVK